MATHPVTKPYPVKRGEVFSDNSHAGRWSHFYSSRSCLILLGLLLVGLVFGTFFPATQNGFLSSYGDDTLYITDNSHVNTGLTWENVQWAFRSMERSNWHPLTWISHMADCELYGLKPFGHHLTSVVWHVINTLLLFLLLRRMTRATGRSFAVALLFGLHPLRVESVAWIAERKDVLSTLFWLLTLVFYGRYVETIKTVRARGMFFYGAALVAFACGLLSKGMVVTLPFVLLLLDYWPLERGKSVRDFRKLAWEKTPFFLLALGVSGVTYATQKSWGFVQTLDHYSWKARLENAVVSYVRYLGKIFWPQDLCVFYPHPGHWPLTALLLSIAVVLGISVLLFRIRSSQKYLLVGWCWFLGTLVPVIGLVQLGDQAMADRYTYVPMIGVLLVAVWGIYEVTKLWRYQAFIHSTVLIAIVIFYTAWTRQQISYFKDSLTLWGHCVAVTGKHGIAQYAWALSLDREGRTDDAIRELEEIAGVKPEWADLHCNLGVMLCKQGRLDEGIVQYREALKQKPDLTEAHYYLGLAWARQNLLDDAIVQFREAARLSSRYAPAHDALGTALEAKGSLDEAIAEFQEALKLRSDNPKTYNNLGVAFFKKGNTSEAIAHFKEALRLKPDFADARKNLEAVTAVPKSIP